MNPKEFAEEFVHKLRVLLEHFDSEAFRQAKLSGFDIPICPVIVSATPEGWDILEGMEVGTILAYKHDGPPIVWNNFQFQNAYFIWTSAIMQLASRLQMNGLILESVFTDNMSILAMLAVRKRVVRFAECIPAFRFYNIDDLPLEVRGDVFKEGFLKESVLGRDYERVDQLVLARLLSSTIKQRRTPEDYSLSIKLLINA